MESTQVGHLSNLAATMPHIRGDPWATNFPKPLRTSLKVTFQGHLCMSPVDSDLGRAGYLFLLSYPPRDILNSE